MELCVAQMCPGAQIPFHFQAQPNWKCQRQRRRSTAINEHSIAAHTDTETAGWKPQRWDCMKESRLLCSIHFCRLFVVYCKRYLNMAHWNAVAIWWRYVGCDGVHWPSLATRCDVFYYIGSRWVNKLIESRLLAIDKEWAIDNYD